MLPPIPHRSLESSRITRLTILNSGSGFIADGRPGLKENHRSTEMSSPAHPQSLRDLASRCGARHTGDGSTLVSGIASIASARPGDLVFAENQVKLDEALRSQATAVIVGEFAAAAPLSKPTLIARDPKLAFARVAALFTKIENCEGCHESAQIHLSSQIWEYI